MRNNEIRTLKRLCSLLHLKEEYILDLASRANSCYYSYDKKSRKKDGTAKIRHIDSPNIELKNIQKKIDSVIIKPYVNLLPDYIHGARTGKSIVTNATNHTGHEAILSLDIENCFPNITSKRIYYIFRNTIHCSDKVASVLTTLTTKDGALPQGCPTSASLCNLVLVQLIEKLSEIDSSLDYNISHYIDDIFYSGRYCSLQKIRKPAMTEIGKNGFRPNTKKTLLVKNGRPMKVTGITVNTKVSAGRRRIRKIQRKILKITEKDKAEYNIVLKNRKRNNNSKIKACKIEKLFGEISNVISINKEQGYRLKKKIEAKLNDLAT